MKMIKISECERNLAGRRLFEELSNGSMASDVLGFIWSG